MKNLFIVVDGMDGSGKTEMVKRIHNWLFSYDKKCKILTTREPSNGPYGKTIRTMLSEEKDPMEHAEKFLQLFVDDRDDHLAHVIEPFLLRESGHAIVLCDRYYYSTYAFQQVQGIPFERIRELNKNFRKPDIAFILDLPPEVALQRVSVRGGEVKEKFENLEFMKKLRGNFTSLKTQLEDNLIIINADRPMDDNFREVKHHIEQLIGK